MLTEDERVALLETNWPSRDVADPDDKLYAPRDVASVKISDALGRVGVDAGLYAFGGSDAALPALPGLVVRDAGAIPIPLAESFASCLLDQCTQVETNRWELLADQVWMKKPEWNRAMGDLGVGIGEKLGFEEALLDVILSKLVVFGPGARLERRKDAEESEGHVATLVMRRLGGV
ncbi:unnamed protein product [Phytophthora lilii]|uniref:Unnamed protein product n=1 Tax=Phytophthora lilii TaxID=2077276 RepID=A0A9W6WJ60_9STRA|nr:unnamed protein product [Phytophthora lilii]